MDQQWNADVVVPIECADLAIVGRLRRMLDLSGPGLRRLILVDGGGLRGAVEVALDEVALSPRVQRLHGSVGEGWSELCNLGLGVRSGDAVIATSEVEVGEGWLGALAEAAHSEERLALAAPVEDGRDPHQRREVELRKAVEGLPRWSPTPRAGAGCNYLRGEALDAVGLLDPRFRTAPAALDEWLARAAAVGFFSKRANRALVFLAAGRPTEDRSAATAEAADRAVLAADRPLFAPSVERFERTLDASLTRHAVDVRIDGRLRVALDLRHLPMEQNGTRMYAVNLGKALAAVPEIDLSLIAAHPIQADGVPGRVVHPDAWADDAAVVHKPAQIFDRSHAELLFGSRAHVFITYQDLIAYRTPGVFPSEDDFNAYRNTSRLTLQAAQGVLAYSQCTAREIAEEFALPIEEVSPIGLGVDVEAFGSPVADLDRVKARLDLPSRYFLCLAGDYPHKNTLGLIEAYSELRRDWKEGEPPALVLAGNAPVVFAGVRGRPGVHCAGVVSADELRALYQGAEALVFPSLYEGFGLPPLEAMAAGAPIIAMPFSSVPEVCGDAALYADGLRPADLSRAMVRLASDPDARAELVARGRRHIETLRWEATARATYQAYRRAVLRPSPRSLRMRRFLNEAIVRWSRPPEVVFIAPAAPSGPVEAVEPAEPPPLEAVEPMEPVEPPPAPAPQPEEAEPVPAPPSEPIEPAGAAEETAPETAEAGGWSEPAPVEPMGVINACCALREAVGRRVRRDLGHLTTARRLRVSAASRLSRRFIEVVRRDGLGEALIRTTRRLGRRRGAARTLEQRD